MPVTLAIVGCGSRGKNYAAYCQAFPDEATVIAIAEPRPNTRIQFAEKYKVEPSLVFEDWKDLRSASVQAGKPIADAVIIAVQDHMHCEVTLAFVELGYHILCEKPMATTMEDCIKMKDAVEKANIVFGLGHVLRYTPYTRGITEVIRSGKLGRPVNIAHLEPIGFFHFAHSFVRGNWGNEKESSFSLMTKSCHDIDLLCHWLAPAVPKRISSFGSLSHFRKEDKPVEAGSAVRCLECPLKDTCAYSAKKVYLDPLADHDYKKWPVSTIIDGIPDIENVTSALNSTNYGQCVYESSNDVCDNQVVNIEFSNGTTVSFTMVAFTSQVGERQTRIHFTNGELVGDFEKFEVSDFTKGRYGRFKNVYYGEDGDNPGVEVKKPTLDVPSDAHGGGDSLLMRAFVKAVKEKSQEPLGTDVADCFRSVVAVFAAEESRKTGMVVDVEEFEKRIRADLQATLHSTFVYLYFLVTQEIDYHKTYFARI
ncbi:hypothetical protein DL96DRAFT_1529208 [Flagelloscypha sp. PMI_526]|nr:hypothetical protein DL96DRAFT_1529208 [Flagelloscypha sp. PMI_526]